MLFSKPKLILVQQRMFTQEIYQLFMYKFLKIFTETIQKTYGVVIVHKKFFKLSVHRYDFGNFELIQEIYNSANGRVSTLVHDLISFGLNPSVPQAFLLSSFNNSSRTSVSKIGQRKMIDKLYFVRIS